MSFTKQTWQTQMQTPIPSVWPYGSTFFTGSVTEKTKNTKMNVNNISNANPCPTFTSLYSLVTPNAPRPASGVHP